MLQCPVAGVRRTPTPHGSSAAHSVDSSAASRCRAAACTRPGTRGRRTRFSRGSWAQSRDRPASGSGISSAIQSRRRRDEPSPSRRPVGRAVGLGSTASPAAVAGWRKDSQGHCWGRELAHVEHGEASLDGIDFAGAHGHPGGHARRPGGADSRPAPRHHHHRGGPRAHGRTSTSRSPSAAPR